MDANKYLSQTELAIIYGTTSHKIGKWLKGLGLKTSSRPSKIAFDERWVIKKPSTQPGTYFYVWDGERTCELFDRMGYVRAIGQSGIELSDEPSGTRV